MSDLAADVREAFCGSICPGVEPCPGNCGSCWVLMKDSPEKAHAAARRLLSRERLSEVDAKMCCVEFLEEVASDSYRWSAYKGASDVDKSVAFFLWIQTRILGPVEECGE